jgi:hypothetical protein
MFTQPPHPDAALYEFMHPLSPYFGAGREVNYRPSPRALREATAPSTVNPARHSVNRWQIVKAAFHEICHLWAGLVVQPVRVPTKPWEGIQVMDRSGQFLNILVIPSDFRLGRCPNPPETILEPPFDQIESLEDKARRRRPWQQQFGIPEYLITRQVDGLPAWQRYATYVSADFDNRSQTVRFLGWAHPEQVRDAPRHLQRFVKEDEDGQLLSEKVRSFAHIHVNELHPMRALFGYFHGFDFDKLKAAKLIA